MIDYKGPHPKPVYEHGEVVTIGGVTGKVKKRSWNSTISAWDYGLLHESGQIIWKTNF